MDPEVRFPVIQIKNPTTGEYEILELKLTNGKLEVTVATEGIADLKSLLDAFNAEDFASDTRPEAVRLLLNSLDEKDFSTSDKQDEIINALRSYHEASVDSGTATGGSNTTIVDTNKIFGTNILENALVEVLDFLATVFGGLHLYVFDRL